MKRVGLLLIWLLQLMSIAGFGQNKDLYLFIGTYTSKTSEGIYVYKFNTQTGDFSPVSIAKGIKNPSFLALSPDNRYLYSVAEMSGGAVSAFAFDKQSGNLTMLNTQSAGGNGPCHVAVDKTGKWVMVGNYGGGSLSILPVQADGSLGAATQTIQHEGKSVNTARQEKPHVHSINIAPNNKDVFVPDLGTDKIMTYTLDTKAGKLLPGNPPFTSTTPGAGPRHFTFHPNGKWAYVINELDATMTGFQYKSGKLEPYQTVSTLPADYTGQKWCADIHISPDGKFLYGSNRAHESLVIFSIHPKTGELIYVGHQNVLGKTPRNFMIDPTGKWVLVANQDSDNVVIFSRDMKTGQLTPTGKEIKVSMPVCLKTL
ncbi:MAG: lactonase family protein [Spirosomataceae bacterium]